MLRERLLMKFESHDVLPFPADDVFQRAARDLHLLEHTLPDVDRVEALSVRMLAGYVIERVDRWTASQSQHGMAAEITQASWVVTSRWDLRKRRATWTIDVEQPRDAAASTGTFLVRSRADGSSDVSITGDVRVMGYALPIPMRALAIALAPMAERVVVRMLERNLAALFGGVEGLLESQLLRAS